MSTPTYYHAVTNEGKHCPTCLCAGKEEFYAWRSQKWTNQRNSAYNSRLLSSRFIPNHDPTSQEVGNNIIPNKTIWFKSVSPRPNKITIRVSSPDRPNLRPSQVGSSVQKRVSIQSPISPKAIQTSQVVEFQQGTPLKRLMQKNSIDQYSQSTMYSPQHTQRRIQQIARTSRLQQH